MILLPVYTFEPVSGAHPYRSLFIYKDDEYGKGDKQLHCTGLGIHIHMNEVKRGDLVRVVLHD